VLPTTLPPYFQPSHGPLPATIIPGRSHLADGGGGVAGGVQGVGALADVLSHACHLGNATSVV
jgi:hypothetical protein